MSRRMILSIVAVLFISILGERVSALPRFALMRGVRCGSCHMNPTGGQMRSEFGLTFATDRLGMEAFTEDDLSLATKITDNISIGGDYRSQFMYERRGETTTFQSMATTIYGWISLSRKVALSLKYDLVNGTYSGGPFGGVYNGTEVYGIARILPKGGYIKGGSFMPDYGWRIDDHTAYTRAGDLGFVSAVPANGLIFLPNYKDIGAEVGVFIQDLSITAGLFNGSGHIRPLQFSEDKAYVVKIEYGASSDAVNVRAGISGYGFKSYKMGGIHAGIGVKDFVLFGEIDWTQNGLSGTTVIADRNSMAAFLEANYQVIRGVWLVGRFDMFDPIQGISNNDNTPATNTLERVTVGMELFPIPFVEIRPQYRFAIEHPNIQNDLALVQMHLWF